MVNLSVKNVGLKEKRVSVNAMYEVGVDGAHFIDGCGTNIYGTVYANRICFVDQKPLKGEIIFTTADDKPPMLITYSSVDVLIKDVKMKMFNNSKQKQIIDDDGVLKELLEPIYEEYMKFKEELDIKLGLRVSMSDKKDDKK